jgi:hypothetical protein
MQQLSPARQWFVTLMAAACIVGAAALLVAWLVPSAPAYNFALRMLGLVCIASAIGVFLWSWRTGRSF